MKNLKILSLGAGVQSSCLALMAEKGEIEMPDHAIFADVGAEPKEVYDYFNYLKTVLSFPVHMVKQGDLDKDFLNALRDPKGRCGQPPFMVKNHDKPGKAGEARIWRKCTKEYKIDPIRRKTRELRESSKQKVDQLIGISLDEAHRMKPSGVKYIKNIYPLIDLRMSRHDCLMWMKKNGYRTPPRSACWFCPYMSNARIRHIRDNDSDSWDKLVKFDHAMREAQRAVNNGAKITGTLYVHRSCIPVDEVDLSTDLDRGQMSLFGEECEGMCGL